MISTYPIESSSGSGNPIIYDDAQDLTTEQQIQAQENVGFALNDEGELVVQTVNGPKRILLVD